MNEKLNRPTFLSSCSLYYSISHTASCANNILTWTASCRNTLKLAIVDIQVTDIQNILYIGPSVLTSLRDKAVINMCQLFFPFIFTCFSFSCWKLKDKLIVCEWVLLLYKSSCIIYSLTRFGLLWKYLDTHSGGPQCNYQALYNVVISKSWDSLRVLLNQILPRLP